MLTAAKPKVEAPTVSMAAAAKKKKVIVAKAAAVELPVPAVEAKTARKESQKYQDMHMPAFMQILASLARKHDYIAGRVEFKGCVVDTELNGARGYVVNVNKDGRLKVMVLLAAGGVEIRAALAQHLRRLPQCKKLDESDRAGEVLTEWQKLERKKLEPWDD